jgi:transposase
MSEKKLNPYSLEFKESAIKLAVGSGLPIAQIAKELGVNASTLQNWINKYFKPKKHK